LLTYEFSLPRLPPDRVVNPIGAGDACGGVVLSAALQSRRRNEGGEVVSKEEDIVVAAFRLGLAAASASCLTEETGVFARGRASALERMITLKVHVTQ
jgi:sugar/nucleoside kinase (ribokinase family)